MREYLSCFSIAEDESRPLHQRRIALGTLTIASLYMNEQEVERYRNIAEVVRAKIQESMTFKT